MAAAVFLAFVVALLSAASADNETTQTPVLIDNGGLIANDNKAKFDPLDTSNENSQAELIRSPRTLWKKKKGGGGCMICGGGGYQQPKVIIVPIIKVKKYPSCNSCQAPRRPSCYGSCCSGHCPPPRRPPCYSCQQPQYQPCQTCGGGGGHGGYSFSQATANSYSASW